MRNHLNRLISFNVYNGFMMVREKIEKLLMLNPAVKLARIVSMICADWHDGDGEPPGIILAYAFARQGRGAARFARISINLPASVAGVSRGPWGVKK